MPAVVGIFGEAAADDVIEVARCERLNGGNGRWLFFENRGGDGELRFAFESALAGEGLVENAAERKKDSAAVDLSLNVCTPSNPAGLARPKSSNLAPDFVSMMLPGLRSR